MTKLQPDPKVRIEMRDGIKHIIVPIKLPPHRSYSYDRAKYYGDIWDYDVMDIPF